MVKVKKKYQYKMKRIKFVLTVAILFFTTFAFGQEITKDDIEVKVGKSSDQDPTPVFTVRNKSSVEAMVLFIGGSGHTEAKNIKPGEDAKIIYDCKLIKAKAKNGQNEYITLFLRKKEEKKIEIFASNSKNENNEDVPALLDRNQIVEKTAKKVIELQPVEFKKTGPLSMDDIVLDFNNFLESIPDLSISYITEESSAVDAHINNMRNWKDKDAYISEHHLNKYINTCVDSLSQYKKTSFLDDYINKFADRKIANRRECLDSLQNILTDRLTQRDANLARLSEEINGASESESLAEKNLDWRIIGASFFLLIIILLVWFLKANKKRRTTTLANSDPDVITNASSTIVVRRKTTSVLRKQSLEDVIDNKDYLKIDSEEFCDDSAVRRIYIKNTCIKDIYNMYAEDLRNPNNPKEDGCMVLGRWVHDKENDEYYVSLEQIVLPGDDAVFSEYELNFGGKIKLKIREKLGKLRKETNLQYDLTCWVHSHPGLGVFFSNSDSNVQMQLKHSTHPSFLTAIVVDILTPQQDLGIFTFKRDSSINSKADLKRLYSLEELYKWAVESDRRSFKSEDYYNSLIDAKSHANSCSSIELSNGAIIDMGMLVAEQNVGLAGMIHGYSHQQGLQTEYIAMTVSKNEIVPDNELVGCFVVAPHCSIPSIRKTISSYLGKIQFILVYATTDGLLTSIPVINQDICTDENYYGEQLFEDLKIWTRRKR